MQDYEYSLKKLSTKKYAECPTCTQELTLRQKNNPVHTQHSTVHMRNTNLHGFTKLIAALKQTIITMHGRA